MMGIIGGQVSEVAKRGTNLIIEMEMVSGKVFQGCPNAGNPFHECTAICLEILNSGNVHKKEKKLFTPPSRDTPTGPSPARGSSIPLPAILPRRRLNQTLHLPLITPMYFSPSRPSPPSVTPSRPVPTQNEPNNIWTRSLCRLPLAGYSGGYYFSRRDDQRGGEDSMYSPSRLELSLGRPEHPLRTPLGPPHTPQHTALSLGRGLTKRTLFT
ncbi:LOW QUALITY PROTEIN: hypothetical protein HID58_057765 [Brassica napus]|uniref:Peptidylprolyl isomerase n=1 Tax=Brassica napus TaxID=3708 RepID=A0ABQ7XHH8_BRANA|nr:LOW QUALITY PROTEIN: hypothetical protein HID58_057765 [Brassica napus]